MHVNDNAAMQQSQESRNRRKVPPDFGFTCTNDDRAETPRRTHFPCSWCVSSIDLPGNIVNVRRGWRSAAPSFGSSSHCDCGAVW